MTKLAADAVSLAHDYWNDRILLDQPKTEIECDVTAHLCGSL
jgi:hypothetical protein